jgi:hypothetical protein
MPASDETTRLVVEGITEDGRPFRPSDWVERLIDSVSNYGHDRRARCSPYRGPDRRQGQLAFLQAQMLNGKKCLRVDLRLREANPIAFEFLMDFVRSNRLRCHERE